MAFKFSVPNSNIKNASQNKTGTHAVQSETGYVPVTKNAQWAGAGASNVVYGTPMFFSPIHTPQQWQIASKRKEVYQWARFYYSNEPKVAAGIDFYANFPITSFKLACKDKKITEFYEQLVEDIDLHEVCRQISFEYFLLGDVFPFAEIHCPTCGGSGVKPNGNVCNHPEGTISRVLILNPDWVEVQNDIFAKEPVITLIPDEDTRLIVQRKEPRQIYDNLPDRFKELVLAGQPIPLSSRCVSHLAHNASPYGVYGNPLIRRLFTVLAYKTKLMTANWIVAERLILPIRVIKLGDKDRPATQEDISDVSQQITNVANDPNLTLVTHHAFSYDWHGASGKIHNISNDLEFVSKEILDGLMLNQAILSGEMQGYASAQVGVEILLKRLESWRLKLTKWIEKHIFLPVAMMQGFKDEQKSELLNRPVYLYPKIEWEDLNLRDKTNMRNQLMQLYDKQLISAQKLLESFDIDYDQMTEERRQEAIVTGAMGQIMGMPGGGMGGLGGGLGGGMPMGGGMPPMGGGLGGDLGGGLGGDLGGGLGDMGGMPPAGGMPGGGMAGGEMGQAAASIPSNFKITKKGKSKQQEKEQEQRSPQYKTIPLTSLEQKLYKKLATMKIPYPLFGQYKVGVPGENQPFVIDFAYPHLGVGLEADGAKWHENLEDKSKNMERDHKLASLGWRVLRFNENAINQQMDEIEKIVYQHIHDAAQDKKKKKADSDKVIKIASSEGLQSEKIVVYKETIPNNIGVVYYIGLR